MEEQSLPFHIAKAGVDYFFSQNPSRHIRFYGPGEPTMEFSLMRGILEYAQSVASSNVTAEIQTNGCFNESIREWMLENINIIWVSFDGEPDIQNSNRPLANGNASSSIIEKNVKWLIKNAGQRDLMVGARVTMTNENLARQTQIVDYFASLGIRYTWSDPVFPSVEKAPVCNDNERSIFTFNMDKYVENYIEAYRYAEKNNLFYGSFLTCNFDGHCSQHCRTCVPVPHFTPDGYISACDLAIFGTNAHHMDCFIYGKWNEHTKSFDIDDAKVAKLRLRNIDSIEHCQDCEARFNCGGYCMGEVMNETGSLYGQKHDVCVAIRRLFNEIGLKESYYPYMHP
jgi:radical SAM protein with 4Fe4S-binding SPASM domain